MCSIPECLCGLGTIPIWMPLEGLRVWNPGIKQVRISEEKKEVDILRRVCSVWPDLEQRKCRTLET